MYPNMYPYPQGPPHTWMGLPQGSPRPPLHCYVCGEAGHTARLCPNRAPAPTTPAHQAPATTPPAPAAAAADCASCLRRKKRPAAAKALSVTPPASSGDESDDTRHRSKRRRSTRSSLKVAAETRSRWGTVFSLLEEHLKSQGKKTPWPVHRAILLAIDPAAGDEPSVDGYKEAILKACSSLP